MVAESQEVSAATAAVRGLGWWWRLAVSGLHFCVFGLGALLAGTVALPLVWALPGSAAVKRDRARQVIQRALRAFVAFVRVTGTLTYEIHGQQRLGRDGQLIIANHPSMVDVVFLLAFTRAPLNCVVKQGLWRNPLTRWAVMLTQFIPNQPTVGMIDAAATALRQGEGLIMFPEGTRSRSGEPMTFHRGAASVALRGAQVLTPVYIRCEPPMLAKDQPWYRIPPRRPHITLQVGEDLVLDDYRALPGPQATRALNTFLQTHFDQQLR